MKGKKKIGLWILALLMSLPSMAAAQWPGDLVWNVPTDNVGTSVPALLSMRVAVGEQRRFRARLTYGGQVVNSASFDLYQFMSKDVKGYTVSTLTMTPEAPTTGGWVVCTFTNQSLPANAYYGAIVATSTTANLKLIAGWWKISLTGLLPTTALGAGTHDEVIVTTLTATNIRTQTLYSPDLQTSFTNTAKTNAANDWRGYAQTNFGNMTGTGTLTIAGNVGIGDTSPQSLFSVGNGDKFTVNASGETSTAATAMYLNKSGPDADQSIYFYEGGSPTGARFGWNNTPGRYTMIGGGLQVNGLGTTDGWGTTITAGAATKAVRGLVILTSGTTGKVDRALDVSGTTGFTSSDHLIYAKSNAYLTGDGDWIGRNMTGLEGVSAGTYWPYSGNWRVALWTASDRFTFLGRPTTGAPVVTTGSAVGEWSMSRLSTRSQFVSDTSYSIRASVERRSQTLLTTGTSAVDFVMPDMATLWSRNHETTGTICSEFTLVNASNQTCRVEASIPKMTTFWLAGTTYTELVLNAGATVTLMQSPRPAWQWIVKSRDGTVTGI